MVRTDRIQSQVTRILQTAFGLASLEIEKRQFEDLARQNHNQSIIMANRGNMIVARVNQANAVACELRIVEINKLIEQMNRPT